MNSSSGPRILFVVNDAGFFLSHRRALADAATETGYDVHVAVPQGAAFDGVQAAGFQSHAITLDRRSLNPLHGLQTIRSLTRLYRTIRPDLVHHVTIKPVVFGGVASRRAKVPAVVNAITGLGWLFIGRGPKAAVARSVARAGYRASFRHPNMRAIFQNEDDRDLFVNARLLPERLTTLVRGSGVDTTRFAPTPIPDTESPIIALPARMLWDKGVATFVEAARALKTRGIDARFVLVGRTDPANRAAIPEETLHEWAQEGVLEWWGFRSDMEEVYRQAAVVCLPSRREGVPLALLEASSCARPIVTTDAPGCRDVVVHGETGLMVPTDDHMALAAALERLITNPDLRTAMGAAGRCLVEDRFDRNRIVTETLAVYQSLLTQNGAAA